MRTELADDPKNFPRLNAAYLEASKKASQPLRPGDTIPLKGVRVKALASDGKTVAEQGLNPRFNDAKLDQGDPSDNARRAGFVLEFGDFRFLDLGDLTWNVEQASACPADAIGRVELYQVTYHGAANSSHPTLLATVQPQVAVVNNGPRKGASPEVLAACARWDRSGASTKDIATSTSAMLKTPARI